MMPWIHGAVAFFFFPLLCYLLLRYEVASARNLPQHVIVIIMSCIVSDLQRKFR